MNELEKLFQKVNAYPEELGSVAKEFMKNLKRIKPGDFAPDLPIASPEQTKKRAIRLSPLEEEHVAEAFAAITISESSNGGVIRVREFENTASAVPIPAPRTGLKNTGASAVPIPAPRIELKNTGVTESSESSQLMPPPSAPESQRKQQNAETEQYLCGTSVVDENINATHTVEKHLIDVTYVVTTASQKKNDGYGEGSFETAKDSPSQTNSNNKQEKMAATGAILQQQQQQLQQQQQQHANKDAVSQDAWTWEMLNPSDSDDENHFSRKHPLPPVWSLSTIRRSAILMQEQIPIEIVENFFSTEPITPNLQEIFPNVSERDLRRGSSAIWNTPPCQSDEPKH